MQRYNNVIHQATKSNSKRMNSSSIAINGNKRNISSCFVSNTIKTSSLLLSSNTLKTINNNKQQTNSKRMPRIQNSVS